MSAIILSLTSSSRTLTLPCAFAFCLYASSAYWRKVSSGFLCMVHPPFFHSLFRQSRTRSQCYFSSGWNQVVGCDDWSNHLRFLDDWVFQRLWSYRHLRPGTFENYFVRAKCDKIFISYNLLSLRLLSCAPFRNIRSKNSSRTPKRISKWFWGLYDQLFLVDSWCKWYCQTQLMLAKEELFQYEKRNALCLLMDASMEC